MKRTTLLASTALAVLTSAVLLGWVNLVASFPWSDKLGR
jgi:hypothetical protein